MKRRANPNTWTPLYAGARFANARWPGAWLVTLPQWRSYLAVVDDFGNLVEVVR